ncbi:MAG: hypothetical protein ACREQL_12545, partial [Candidatus Binatia bacterium]
MTPDVALLYGPAGAAEDEEQRADEQVAEFLGAFWISPQPRTLGSPPMTKCRRGAPHLGYAAPRVHHAGTC